ncbi:hypothetical protein SAMN05421805_101714 [Saccharopolyspora antimicrobica]|uniref:Uncharacterized protein n=1 Tax=Saccharopolyspora antimicrobica TaxID=455193 RepID=A0A1I4RVK5_9PSEU|nr:hypothetical protein [Saccharopolyspora antimicrobica]RKT89162.1 hypothetical protein ATL45_7611 [Saccharopolyspora antimicrobica]SFM56262.1 hypothetical protein SAMN05421805_101714 [Saccharopolyspora antimicrobica]
MTERSKGEEPTAEEPVVGESPEPDGSAQAGEQVEAAQHDSSDEAAAATTEAEESATTEAEESSAAASGGGKKGLFIGLGSGLLVGAVAALAFAGFVKPDFLVGPGKPDGTASAVTAALAGKDAAGLAASSCRAPDGTLAPQLPPQALQLIQSAEQSGPPRRSLDSEALTPVDLTINVQGQTQTVPIDVVLGVTGGDWCMKGIADRQQ